jgi:hypothetical protein
MDVSSVATSQIGDAVGIAVQKMTLDSMKRQGAQVAATLASTPAPRGSVNTPGQGTLLDAFA